MKPQNPANFQAAPNAARATSIGMIACEADIAAALDRLAARCAVMARIIPACGPIPLRRREGGLAGLAAIIVSQQVSVASANAIWARVVATFDPLTPTTILAADDATMRAAGLSAPKQRTLRAIATALLEGTIDLDALGALPVDEARGSLVTIKGVGPWTADLYLMFCVGHPDVFAPGDLALQEAAKLAWGLDVRPGPDALSEVVAHLAPDRAVVARVLWAYYGVAKSRAGVVG